MGATNKHRSRLQRSSPVTPIAAKILKVDRLGDQYLITVCVGVETYRGTFDGLNFAENEPHFGSYRNGWLDLVYHQDPGLKAGQRLTLWVIDGVDGNKKSRPTSRN
jgi:hypothetical protein